MSHPFENPDNTTFCTLSCSTDGRHITLVEDLRGEICRCIVDTEEQMLRQTLIKLGWSPPERTQELVGALLRINEDVWPLVHGLTHRQTLRDFMRTLPDIINRRPT